MLLILFKIMEQSKLCLQLAVSKGPILCTSFLNFGFVSFLNKDVCVSVGII